VQELGHERRIALRTYAAVARGAFAQELGEPGLVLDLLVQDGQRQVVGAVVLDTYPPSLVNESANRFLMLTADR
jgi:hypothetical protein